MRPLSAYNRYMSAHLPAARRALMGRYDPVTAGKLAFRQVARSWSSRRGGSSMLGRIAKSGIIGREIGRKSKRWGNAARALGLGTTMGASSFLGRIAKSGVIGNEIRRKNKRWGNAAKALGMGSRIGGMVRALLARRRGRMY